MNFSWSALFLALIAVNATAGSVAVPPPETGGGAPATIYDPDTLNALPGTPDRRRVRVKGILRIHSDTDGPYLFQDMRAYVERGHREHMVTVAWFADMHLHLERYEAALVVITGDYGKSGCRAPDAVCPHMKNELTPVSVEVVGYPNKAAGERLSDAGHRPLLDVTASDPQWAEISDVAHVLVRAVRERDAKALRKLIDPGNAADYPPEALDDAMAPGGRVDWRLFAPENAFVTDRNPMPAFRAYAVHEAPYGNELRAVAICFDKKIRSDADWPNSEFDLDSENVGDPFVCVTAFKTARGWWLDI